MLRESDASVHNTSQYKLNCIAVLPILQISIEMAAVLVLFSIETVAISIGIRSMYVDRFVRT